MIKLRRFGWILFVVALAPVAVTGAQAASGARGAPSTPHDAMSMAGGEHAATVQSCDHCTTPPDAVPACDHPGAPGSCDGMMSCTIAPAETQSPSSMNVAAPADVIVAGAVALVGRTLSPDTPPPRA